MANEIRANLEVRGGPAASRELKNLGDSAAKAGDQVEDLGADSKVAGEKVDGLTKKTKESGDSLGDMAKEAGFLDREVTRLEADLKGLVTQLNKTGDVSLKKDIRRTQRELRQNLKLSDIISPRAAVGGAVQAGSAVGQGIIEGASGFIKGPGGPILGGALAAAGVAATPFLGSAIAAAVLGGAGAGGIIGGIALAAQDPRVKAAAEEFAAGALGDLGADLGAPFVDPAIAGLQLLGSTVEDVSGDIGPAFADLSREVGPLVKGIDGLARNAVPGLVKALDAAEPVLRALANQMPEVGAAVSDMFESFSEGGDGATMALDVFLDAVKGAMITVGDLVSILGQTYEAAVLIGVGLGDAADDTSDLVKVLFPLLYAVGGLNNLLDDQVNALDAAKKPADEFGTALQTIGTGANSARREIEELDTAVDKMFGEFLGLKDATIGYEAALDSMVEGLKEGRRTLDEGSEAGRENWQVIQAGVRAANDMRQANIDSGMAVAEADLKWQAQIATLRANSVAILGSQKALTDYWTSVQSIPDVTRKRILFEASEVGNWSRVRAMERGEFEAGRPLSNPSPAVKRRAHGGPVKAGEPYLVGEEGRPELFVPDQNGTIVPGATGASAMGGAGQPPINLNVVVSARASDQTIGAALARFMIPYLQVEVNNQGGDVQATLGNGAAVT